MNLARRNGVIVIRLIAQHELTHLVEMNHSPRFHALLDEAVGGREAEYEAELKRFDTNIFTLL